MNAQITASWWYAVAPEISLVILLFVVLLYHRFVKPEESRRIGQFTAWGAGIILLLTLGLWIFAGEPNANATLGESLMWGGMIRHDLVTLVFRVMFLTALMLTSLVSLDVPRLQKSEYYGLLIAATIGFSLMAASADLIMLYVGLETASISSYVLAGFMTNDKRSTEAGMKYFIYGAFATGLMLYGMSLLYGVIATLFAEINQVIAGPTNYYVLGQLFGQIPPISEVINNPDVLASVREVNGVLLLAAAMIVAGFGFKVSAVPFHFWTPDVYEGSPTPFTGFVSTASKAAGFAVFIRVFSASVLGEPSQSNAWWAMLVAMCVITMTIGNFAAIFQKNIKRMLAYSSIAQAGYALIGLVTFTQDSTGATMFYLLMYVFSNIAAFGVIMMVSNVTKSDDMEAFYGLSRRSPYLALVMLFALLSLGGIPPTAGFVGKFLIFRAAVLNGYWALALVGILNAFVALYYYLNVVKYMYLYRSDEEDVALPVSRAAKIGLALSVFFIIFLGVYGGPAIDWTRQAAMAFFSG